ncbi:mechanosensitive ion channel [Conexibacter sp. JD483]|uniref:mechanosensitive ion channel family protein n=1 Tax=unclassified Conexibacter TaxID=2627773 RepID=UPI002728C7D5|nr:MULTISPECIES: mechanosensitive ion channel domain-containing protein [unclassified Conexibacter]MDO8189587.1 mechanosensitive ion channel [Conexibacter sp. CPCC 205706]MDO8202131.1 mechanosensitive ion channel [Conexibacter sp. CPCC 205762]MDR9373090.1 mechanosensitive ion channel [Conexibacter sp. JD483]
MTVFATVLDRAGDQVGEFLPRLGAALAILLVGLLAIALLARLLRNALGRAGLDRAAERLGVHEPLARLGFDRSLTGFLVGLLRLLATIAVVIAAISSLGLQSLDDALNRALLFLPQLLTAIAILFAGVTLAGLLRERVDRMAYQMGLRGPLGATAQITVLSVAAITALSQLGVATAILIVLAGIVLAGVALTIALAFGLGSQHVARELSAGRYIETTFAIGDEITLDGTRYEITAIEPASSVLTTHDRRRIRIPNTDLLTARVELH